MTEYLECIHTYLLWVHALPHTVVLYYVRTVVVMNRIVVRLTSLKSLPVIGLKISSILQMPSNVFMFHYCTTTADDYYSSVSLANVE